MKESRGAKQRDRKGEVRREEYSRVEDARREKKREERVEVQSHSSFTVQGGRVRV